ncbi:MAG: histidine kinase [Caulobacteraceae bacterium]
MDLEIGRTRDLLQAALNALPIELSIIDEDGVAVAVNEPARRFVLDNHRHYWGPGVPLDEMTANALAPDLAANLNLSLPMVRSGEMPSFLGTYEIRIRGQVHVKQIRVVRFPYARRSMLVITQEDVTDLSMAHREVDLLNRRLLETQEDERRQIARELHDSTGQHLVATSLALAWLPVAQEVSGAQPLAAAAMTALADAAASVGEAQKEIRLLSYLLHPPNLERDGLALCLSQFVTGFSRRSGLACNLRIRGQLGELDFELQRNFLRVVQEALINVHRHAGATLAEVELSRVRNTLKVEVRDDGRGMEREPNPLDGPLGVGIPGMRARLRHLGGTLEIVDGPGGVTVRASAPAVGSITALRDSSEPHSEPGRRSSTRRACASPLPGAFPPS